MLDKLSNVNNQLADYQVKPVEHVPKIIGVSAEKQDQPQQQEPPKEKIEKIMDSMNDFLKVSNTHMEFQYHDELKKYYVAIVDDNTNEVIKEIPSKKLLGMYAAMAEYAGHFLDKKV